MSKTAQKPVTFLATFPDIKSAILVGTDGMQIKLEIPESEKGNALNLLGMMGKVLRVTIDVDRGPQPIIGVIGKKIVRSELTEFEE